jgi:signal transduction histidine kinase
MLRSATILLSFLICSIITYSQDRKKLDSLLGVINSAKHDTLKVEAFYKYGEEFESSNPDTAMHFFLKGKQLAQKIGFDKGIAVSSSYMLIVLNNKGAYKEGLEIAKEAIIIYEKRGVKKDLAIGYTNIGSQWEYLSEYNLAAENYTKALKYAAELNEKKFLRVILNNLASVTITIGNYSKGKNYAEQSLVFAKQLNDKYGIASSLYNIAEAENYLKNHTNALEYFKQIEIIGKETEDDVLILDGMLGKADSYNFLNNTSFAKIFYDSVITMAKRVDAMPYVVNASKGFADCYSKEGNYKAALPINKEGIAVANQLGTKNELQDLLFQASFLNEKIGNTAEALTLYKAAQIIKDSIFSNNNLKSIANIDAKYETEKKETLIKLQQAEIRQKKDLNYLFGGGAIVLSLLSFMGYRSYKQRKKVDQLRIAELETEKQLSATEAVLKGEEQERTRLAKDLHDGLGGMLSGIKYSFNNMKENLILTTDTAQAFSRSMDMLDNSIKEMRRVAHNMMPESLLRYGLDKTLQDYTAEINKSGIVTVAYQSMGMENKIVSNTTAITIYRIVQELLNNVTKHAAAKQVLVQLLAQGNKLVVNVEDDGRGFDTEILERAEGIGWKNIKSRVEFLKGSSDVQSAHGKGTAVNMEFNIEAND